MMTRMVIVPHIVLVNLWGKFPKLPSNRNTMARIDTCHRITIGGQFGELSPQVDKYDVGHYNHPGHHWSGWRTRRKVLEDRGSQQKLLLKAQEKSLIMILQLAYLLGR